MIVITIILEVGEKVSITLVFIFYFLFPIRPFTTRNSVKYYYLVVYTLYVGTQVDSYSGCADVIGTPKCNINRLLYKMF